MYRMIVRGALALAVTATGLLAVTGGASASPAALPTLSFSHALAIASPHGATMTFHAKLSAASTSAVTVHYATENGTALAGTERACDHVLVLMMARFFRRNLTDFDQPLHQ